MKLKTYQQVLDCIYSHIPEVKSNMFPGEFGLERTRYFLELLNNPQDTIDTIHICGTSGKGSTAYITSKLLKHQGYKVGLTLSPHTVDIRERFQINNRFIRKNQLVDYVNRIIPALEQVKRSRFGSPTYFELVTVLGFYIFHDLNIDYAVVETGLGGSYDATNVIQKKNKIAVITSIGLDHMHILGKNITMIATQKSGIIQPHNAVFSIEQRKAAQAVIEQRCREQHSPLVFIKRKKHYRNIHISADGNTFDFDYGKLHLKNIFLALPGEHQIENASLALAVTTFLSERDSFELKVQGIRKALEEAHFPGRLDIRRIRGKTLIIDGAHNPDKMQSLADSLQKMFPEKQFDFLLAFKKGKNYRDMLKKLVSISTSMTLTSFFQHQQDFIHMAEKPEVIQKELSKLHYRNIDIKDKISDTFLSFFKSGQDILVITGSLYLVSEVYLILKKEYGITV